MTSRNTDPHVDIEVTVIISPDGPGDRWPGLADAENTLDVIALEDISRLRVENNRLNTKEGDSSRSWFGFNGTRERRYNDGSGLSLPESVDDGTFSLSDMIVVPLPSLGVDRFADTTQHSEGAEIVGLGVVFTETTEKTDGGRSRVELGDLVLLDSLPVTSRGRVNGGGFEDGGGDTIKKRSVDDVADEEK